MPTDLPTRLITGSTGNDPADGLPHWLRVGLVAMSVIGLWLLFVTVFSDVYQNGSRAALLVAAVLVAAAAVAFRFPQHAVVLLPVVFSVSILLSDLPLISDGSPRVIFPSQLMLAMALAAGGATWRKAPPRAQLWALLLLSLSALTSLQAQLHSTFSISSTWQGIPLALGSAVAAATALTAPPAGRLAAGYVLAALAIMPFTVMGIFREGRAALELGTFSINFVSVLLGMGFVAAVMLYVRFRSGWMAAAAAVLMVSLVLGNSKSVLLGLFVAGCAAVWLNRSRLTRGAIAGWVGATAGLVVVAYAIPALFLSRAASDQPILPGTRTVGDAAISTQLRLDLLTASSPNMLVSPLIGIGPQRNVVYYTVDTDGRFVITRAPMEDHEGTYAPHNTFISMPVTLGIPLALAVGSVWIFAVARKRDPGVRALLVPMVVFAIGTALTIDWERSHLAAVFWLPVGLLLATPDAER